MSKPLANVRRKELLRQARERGTLAGPHVCTIPGCRSNGRLTAILLLDEAIELYGPPAHTPVGPAEIDAFIRAAAAKRDFGSRIVVIQIPLEQLEHTALKNLPRDVDVAVKS